MNWLDVADYLRTKRCFEAIKTGRCGCRARPKNACGCAERMAQSCEAMDRGDIAYDSPADILKLVRYKTCGMSRSARSCQHRSCIWAEKIGDWIEQEMQSQFNQVSNGGLT